MDLCIDQPELDYGRIVDLSATVVCVDIDGTISTDMAATGCTK